MAKQGKHWALTRRRHVDLARVTTAACPTSR
ncbi:putative leader peptide [Phaeacidiphilus oryzae]|jgi:hypothetical protein|nr:putative leader peptide [Phaeacidiphilus oryzae]